MKTYKLPPPQLGEFTATNMPVPPGYVQSLVNFIAVPGGAQGWGAYDLYGDVTSYAGHFYAITGTTPYEVTFTRNASTGAVKALYGDLTTGVYIEQSADRMKDGLYPREYLVHDGLIYICGSESRPYLAGVRKMGYDPTTAPLLAPAGEAPYNVRGSAPLFRVPIVDGGAVRVGHQSVIRSGNQHNVPPTVEFQGGGGSGAAARPIMTLDGIICENAGSGYTNGAYDWKIKAGTWGYGSYNRLIAGTAMEWEFGGTPSPVTVKPRWQDIPGASDPTVDTPALDAYKAVLEGYIGYVLRIESGTHQVLSDYKITGVDATAKDRWILECRPSAYTAAAATVTDIVWSLHEGLPVEIVRCATAQYRYLSSKHYIYPNTNYTVTADDKDRYIQITGGSGWSLLPLLITEADVDNNRWEVARNVGTNNSDRNSGEIVVYGDDKARDATGKIIISGGKVLQVTVVDEGKFLTCVPPVDTNSPFEVTTAGFTTAGTEAEFRARLKVSGLYTHTAGSGYTSTPQVYALYTGNNGPRAIEGGTGPLTGRYEYACTYRYKDSSGQIVYESGLSESFWSVNLASSKAANIQGLSKGNIWTSGMWANDNDYELRPFPTHLVVYRRGGNVGVFRETMEIPWETLNSGRVYIDSKPDADLGVICPTVGTMPPPTGARFVQHHARRMWYAVGDTLYASKQDEPWVCSNDSNPTLLTAPMRFTIEEGMDITGLVSVDRALVVFTNNSAYRIDGTSTQDFRLSKIEAPGCNLYHSAREYRDGVIWHAPAGVYYWRNGFGVENVGLPIGSQAASGTCRSAVFTHQGVEMYLLSTGGSYMRLFSGSGWSSITRPAAGVVDIVGLPASVVGGTTISLRVMTVSTGNGQIHQWPSTTAGGSGSIIWPMQEFGDIGHVKSILATRAMVQGLTTSSTLGYRVDYYNSSQLFTGTTQTAIASAYGNQLIHFRNRGVYGYQLQPALHVTTTNTRLRVHGIEMDVVTRGLARG